MAETAYLRVVVGLIVVIAAILACAWLARRAGLLKQPQGKLMRVVSLLALGPRQRIVMIDVQGTWLVVGVSAGQISLLHTQPAAQPQPDVDRPPEAPPAEQNITALFAGKLAKALNRR
jgi:flagellar protein FliO/FliZ